MTHSPIQFNSLCWSFPHKVCFEAFTTQVHYGNRIAIIGRNGCGKSTLLQLICGNIPRPYHKILIPGDVVIGYVPQLITTKDAMSGSEYLNTSLTGALKRRPNVLILDEPTNHLDRKNRMSLLRMINNYSGTVIVATHDTELLTECINILWHMDQGKINIFRGQYQNYLQEREEQRLSLNRTLKFLAQQKKKAHQALMQEQERAKKSKAKGEKHIQERKWPTIVSAEKAHRASETAGRKKNSIQQKKQEVIGKIAALPVQENLNPTFSLSPPLGGSKMILSVQEGSLGYDQPLLENIYFTLKVDEKTALRGENASGKTTLLKALLNDKAIRKVGQWHVPSQEEIGYLDQHYKTLNPEKTVIETIHELAPHWAYAELRRHLNDFLFSKNEEVNARVATLSGGERVRLSLAQIAAKTPKLLLLDEITNNLDLETRDHVVQVLKNYPGAMIIISHDEDFLTSLHLTSSINIHQFLKRK